MTHSHILLHWQWCEQRGTRGVARHQSCNHSVHCRVQDLDRDDVSGVVNAGHCGPLHTHWHGWRRVIGLWCPHACGSLAHNPHAMKRQASGHCCFCRSVSPFGPHERSFHHHREPILSCNRHRKPVTHTLDECDNRTGAVSHTLAGVTGGGYSFMVM